MTQFLPPNLLALFAPREPLPFLPPVAKLPHEKGSDVHRYGTSTLMHVQIHVYGLETRDSIIAMLHFRYSGIADFVQRANFEHPDETPPPTRVESKEER